MDVSSTSDEALTELFSHLPAPPNQLIGIATAFISAARAHTDGRSSFTEEGFISGLSEEAGASRDGSDDAMDGSEMGILLVGALGVEAQRERKKGVRKAPMSAAAPI
jgi:hypothetical protein